MQKTLTAPVRLRPATRPAPEPVQLPGKAGTLAMMALVLLLTLVAGNLAQPQPQTAAPAVEARP